MHTLIVEILWKCVYNACSTVLPRITLTPSITGLDFAIKLNRHQFPVQLALAMTINKSQGQTIKHVAIDLCKPVFTAFTHGQLYVTFSCVTSSQYLKVLLAPDSQLIHAQCRIQRNIAIISLPSVFPYELGVFEHNISNIPSQV
jgi:helicase-like protein